MANERDDDGLFDRSTAHSLGGALDALPESELEETPDSGLPAVGVESSERLEATLVDRPVRQKSGASLAPLPFQDRYTQRRMLGRGGMGEVRLCRDHTVGRDVAMKVIRPRGESSLASLERRFVREARVQGQLEHPAIVPVYDMGVDPDGALYFTMKRLRGASLAEVLAGLRSGDEALTQRYSRRRLLTLFSQICLAVHFGHEKGVVHRDLKPANLMLGDFGEVYVLDWGLAGLVGERVDAPNEPSAPADEQVSSTGILGTPGYMAPEQIETPGALDARADVYALGAILFELLTLERMHGDGTSSDLMVSTLAGDGPSPAVIAPHRDIPPELDRLCRDAVRRERDARTPSAQELSARIEAYLDGDRDLALRRELARSHAERARTALSASQAPDADEAERRTEAMREVSAALGLDPRHEGAQQTLVRLITEPPTRVPAEAAAEIARNQRNAYLLAGRAGVFFYFGYLLYLPLLLWMGVRDLGLFALGWGTIAACALTTVWLVRRPPERVDVPLVHLAVSTFTVACTSVMFGPFVLVPMLALGNCVAYIASVGHRRGLVPLAGCLAVLAPVLLRVAGLLPNNYRFEGDAWIILPSVFHIDATATQVFLCAGIVGTLVPACLFVQRLRTAYAAAEQRLQLQAWQLRQIVPS